MSLRCIAVGTAVILACCAAYANGQSSEESGTSTTLNVRQDCPPSCYPSQTKTMKRNPRPMPSVRTKEKGAARTIIFCVQPAYQGTVPEGDSNNEKKPSSSSDARTSSSLPANEKVENAPSHDVSSGHLGSPTSSPSIAGISVVPPKLVGLDNDVTLLVPQLDELRKTASVSGQQIILFLDRMPIKKLYADAIDPSTKEVRFRLKRTEDSKEAWNKLLGNPMLYWARPVAISIGLENGEPLASSAKIDLVIVKRLGFLFWVAMVIAILWLLIKYGMKSPVLRALDADSPFSLAQVQMAAWFFLIITSYVFIWLVTGDMNNIPKSVLMLMGISIGTTFGARMIDQSKTTKTTEELAAIEAKIKECETMPDDQGVKKQQVFEEQRTAIKNKIEPKSQGFWNDIISDSYGTSLHRLQALVWTIVLGVIFCYKVYQDFAMPEFDTTLLALMGISSGTYLGFKIPEQR